MYHHPNIQKHVNQHQEHLTNQQIKHILHSFDKFNWQMHSQHGSRIFIIDIQSYQTITDKINNSSINGYSIMEEGIDLVVNKDIIWEHCSYQYKYVEFQLIDQISHQFMSGRTVKVVSQEMNAFIFNCLGCKGYPIERIVKLQRGNIYIQYYPIRVQVNLISAKTIRTWYADRTNDTITNDLLMLQKWQLNWYCGEDGGQLLGKLKQIADKLLGNTEIRVYEYDQTIFDSISFQRYCQYYLAEQDHVFAANSIQQKYFQTHPRKQQTFLLQFFPGKLITASYQLQPQKTSITVYLQYYSQQKWVFPHQPQFSKAKQCSQCLIKNQLYLKFKCQVCNRLMMYCSQVCEYQSLSRHRCSHAKQQFVSKYGQSNKRIVVDQQQIVSDFSEYISELQDVGSCNNSQLLDFQQNDDEYSVLQRWKSIQIEQNYQNSQNIVMLNSVAANRSKAGLPNLGFTCYINAGIQLLAATSLSQQLLKLNPKQLQSKPLVYVFTQIIKLLKQPDQYVTISKMQCFKQVLDNKLNYYFQNLKQHDCHQFLLLFLNQLQHQMNEHIIVQIRQLYYPKTDQQSSQKEWLKLINTNYSPIIRLFYGLTKNLIKCQDCQHSSTSFHPFNIISLSIPQRYQPDALTIYIQWFNYKPNNINRIQISLIDISTEELMSKLQAKLDINEEGRFDNCQRSLELRMFKISKVEHLQEIGRNNETKLIQVVKKYRISKHQNQLFVFVLEKNHSKHNFIPLKFIDNQRIQFTLKRPLFFELSKIRLRGQDIYQKIIFYFSQLLALYDRTNQYTFKLTTAPHQYFFLVLRWQGIYYTKTSKMHYPTHNKLLIQNNKDQIQQLQLQNVQIEVHMMEIQKSSDYEQKMYKNITQKYNMSVDCQDFDLDMKIPAVSLLTCLQEEFDREDELGKGNEWFCPYCQVKKKAVQRSFIYKASSYLCIQVKRFKQNKQTNQMTKINLQLDFTQYIDLSNILISQTLPQVYLENLPYNENNQLKTIKVNSHKSSLFQLVGLILHNGSMNEGHYTAITKKQQQWWLYNDDVVSQVHLFKNQILNVKESAYILMYKRVYDE